VTRAIIAAQISAGENCRDYIGMVAWPPQAARLNGRGGASLSPNRPIE